MSAGPETYRVLCPDGRVVDIVTEERSEDAEAWAVREAETCDRVHDEARCGFGPHRVERAEWEEVARV